MFVWLWKSLSLTLFFSLFLSLSLSLSCSLALTSSSSLSDFFPVTQMFWILFDCSRNVLQEAGNLSTFLIQIQVTEIGFMISLSSLYTCCSLWFNTCAVLISFLSTQSLFCSLTYLFMIVTSVPIFL